MKREQVTFGHAVHKRVIEPRRSEIVRASPVPLCIVSLLFFSSLFFALFAFQTGTLSGFAEGNSRLAAVLANKGYLAFALAGGTTLAILLSIAYTRFRRAFFALLVFAFSFSEIQIPLLANFSLSLRYLLMLVLVAAALLKVARRDVTWGIPEIASTLLMLWMLLHHYFFHTTTASYLYLPIAIATLFGIVVGQQSEFSSVLNVQKWNTALATCGVAITVIHLLSFKLAPEPFLDGRFKSFFPLPTNFSNSYVLLVVPMMWTAVFAKSLFTRVLYFGLTSIGVLLVVLSATRNSVLFLSLAALLFCLATKSRAMYLLGLSVFVALLSFLVSTFEMPFLDAIGSRLSNFSVQNREAVWSLAWEKILANPWVGYGLDSTGGALVNDVASWQRAEFINAHNTYLGIWIQIGILGPILLSLIVLPNLIRSMRVVLDRSLDGFFRANYALPMTLLLGLVVAGIFEENLSSRGSLQQIVWAMSLATCAGIVKPKGSRLLA